MFPENDPAKGCFYFGGITFGLTILVIALKFIFEGKSYLADFGDESSDDISLGFLRTVFILFIISGAVYLYSRSKRNQK